MLVYEYACEYILFFRITLGVEVETIQFYIMKMCSLLRTIFYGSKVVPLRIGFRDTK